MLFKELIFHLSQLSQSEGQTHLIHVISNEYSRQQCFFLSLGFGVPGATCLVRDSNLGALALPLNHQQGIVAKQVGLSHPGTGLDSPALLYARLP